MPSKGGVEEPSPIELGNELQQLPSHASEGIGYTTHTDSFPLLPPKAVNVEEIPVEEIEHPQLWQILWLWKVELIHWSSSFGLLLFVVFYFKDKNGTLWNLRINPNFIISVTITSIKNFMETPLSSGISQMKWVLLKRRHLTLREMARFDDATAGGFVGLTKWFILTKWQTWG